MQNVKCKSAIQNSKFQKNLILSIYKIIPENKKIFTSLDSKYLIGFITLLFFIFFQHLAYPSGNFEVIKNKINVRVDSTITSPSIGYLNKGEIVEVLEEKFSWLHIRLPERFTPLEKATDETVRSSLTGFTCYVWEKYLKQAGANKAEVIAKRLNLRDKPSLESFVLGQAQQGDVLFIIEKKDGWCEVKGYPYLKGWVHKKFIRKLEEKKKEVVLLDQIILGLSEPNMAKKKDVHLQLIQMGQQVVSELESFLPSADIHTTYSIIYILGQIGRNNLQLASDFLEQVDPSSCLASGIYLDVVQDILAPKGARTAYFYRAEEGKLTPFDITKAKNHLYEVYNELIGKKLQPAASNN